MRDSSTLADMAEHRIEGQFVNGLDLVIRAELLVNRPSGMVWILQMAQRIESKNKILRQIKGVGHGGNKLGFAGESGGSRGPMSPTTKGTTLTEKSSGHRTKVSFKRLSDTELQLKHEKELCYRCDEKYSIDHGCKLQELQVVIFQEEESVTYLNTEGEEGSEGLGEGDRVTVELSVNSVVVLTSPKTLKLRGEIKGEGVIVIIDLGATHNFISVELVRR